MQTNLIWWCKEWLDANYMNRMHTIYLNAQTSSNWMLYVFYMFLGCVNVFKNARFMWSILKQQVN